jgi:hypothetical protein
LLLIELSLRRPGDFLAHVAGEFAQRDIVVPIRIGLSPQSPQQIVGEQAVAMPAVFQPLLQLLAADQPNLVLSLKPPLRYGGLGVGFGGGRVTRPSKMNRICLVLSLARADSMFLSG